MVIAADEVNFNKAMEHLITSAALVNAQVVSLTIDGADYVLTLQLDKKEGYEDE